MIVVVFGNGASRLLEGLSEDEELGLVVDRQDTSTGHTTEDVGTSTLEERLDTLLGDDLPAGIDGRLVLDGLRGVLALTDAVRMYIADLLLTSPEVIIMRRRMVSSG